VNGGSFSGSQTVAITDATPAATIYYTIDGSTPDETSFLYSAPFDITDSTVVKAIAVKPGYTNSAIRTASFTAIVSSTTDILFGGNFDAHVTDFDSWGGVLQTILGTPVPIVDLDLDYIDIDLTLGQYAYIFMRAESAAPAAVGGFKNGSFNLTTADFAGASEGFTSVDDNGWPYQAGSFTTGDYIGDYREYRLLNAPFAGIVVTMNQ